jgi:hypothetical protein
VLHRPTIAPVPGATGRHRVERSFSDQSAGNGMPVPEQPGAVVEAVPSMSGAHWANRDNDTLYRRPGRAGALRRPPATGTPTPAPPAPVSPSGFLSTDGVANADLFGPDIGGSGGDTAVRTSRHWTEIGTGTRRPATGDRPEATAPEPTSALPDPGRPRPVGRTSAERDDMIGVIGDGGHEIRPHRAARPSSANTGAGRGNPVPGRGSTAAARGNTGAGRGRGAGRGGAGPIDTGRGTGTADEPRRSRKVLWATMVMVFIVLAGGIGAVVVFSGRPGGLGSVLRAGAGSTSDRTVTAALGGRTEASFELVTGVAKMTLTSQDLGNDLYRITTAEDSGTVPRPVIDDNRVQLHLAADGNAATGSVQIVLSAKVAWALRLTGGADEQRIDLSQGRVSGIDVIGGSRRIELGLPKPTGTVGVRITGAVDELFVTAPADSPVRVQLDSGAKTVTAGTKTQRDVPPGSTFTPRNFDVDDRYDIDAVSRVTVFSVGVPG